MCSPSKEQSILSRETIQNTFFQNYAPFLTFCPQSSTPQPSVGTCMQCSCYSMTQIIWLTLYQMTDVGKLMISLYNIVETTVKKEKLIVTSKMLSPRLRLKPFPNDKMLDVTNLKAFANNKLNIARLMIYLLDSVENMVGKGENAGYQHFLLFPQCFPKPSHLGSLKVRISW